MESDSHNRYKLHTSICGQIFTTQILSSNPLQSVWSLDSRDLANSIGVAYPPITKDRQL